VAKYRSPILGYNHNINHRGLVFHVQTEDSGVDHPHLFTHLFFGGVILNTRKLDYDPEAAESSVKALMQAQHKSILKLLKRGEFDEKIERYFGDNPDLQPSKSATAAAEAAAVAEAPVAEAPVAAAPEPAAPVAEAPAAEAPVAAAPEPAAEPPPASVAKGKAKQSEVSDVSAAFQAIQDTPAPKPAPAKEATGAVPKKRTPTGEYSRRNVTPERVSVHNQATVPVQRGRPVAARPMTARPAGKKLRVSDRVGETRRSNVVVSRPAVIIGAPSKVIGGSAPSAARARPRRFAREEAGKGLFGKDMISEKSLDEVILAYLSDDAAEE